MISSSFAVFALLSKVKSAALQKMKPACWSNKIKQCFFLLPFPHTSQQNTNWPCLSVLQSSSHKIASISFSWFKQYSLLQNCLLYFFLQLFPFSFVFESTILSPRQKYWSKPLTIAESQIEYVPCWKMFGDSQKIWLRLRLFRQYPSVHCYKLEKEI